MPSFMGIDYGLERSGLAISDSTGEIVVPLRTLALGEFGKRSLFLDGLAALIEKEKIGAVVWGWPLLEDGRESDMCVRVRNIAARLARRVPLPMYLMPEILSSREAESRLRARGLKPQKIKAALDQEAACLILRSFLNLPPEKRQAL